MQLRKFSSFVSGKDGETYEVKSVDWDKQEYHLENIRTKQRRSAGFQEVDGWNIQSLS